MAASFSKVAVTVLTAPPDFLSLFLLVGNLTDFLCLVMQNNKCQSLETGNLAILDNRLRTTFSYTFEAAEVQRLWKDYYCFACCYESFEVIGLVWCMFWTEEVELYCYNQIQVFSRGSEVFLADVDACLIRQKTDRCASMHQGRGVEKEQIKQLRKFYEAAVKCFWKQSQLGNISQATHNLDADWTLILIPAETYLLSSSG